MAAAGGEPPAEPKSWHIVLSFTIYGGLNLFLNFFNKWAMSPSGAGFSLPVFYSTWHMLMSIVGSLVLMLLRKPDSGMVSFKQLGMYKWEVFTLAICTTINISCNNASLMLIGLFVNQIIKALSPMIVMAMSYFVLQRRYGWKIIVSVICIAIGAMMAVPFKDPSVTVLGVVLVSVATFASSLKPVVGELLMTASDKPKLAPAALVFYDSCFSFVLMLTYWLSVPAEREGSILYMRTKPAMGWGIILIGSCAAFAYNMSIYNFTKLASAVAVMVTTNLLKVLLITAAAVVEGIRDPLNWTGITIFFAAVVAYAYLTYQGKQAAKKAASSSPVKPTETSNLVSK
jgi:drug/metabolite transporter (DMT)-like permease